MITETVETLVVGAGVVGLAVARRLAMAGREVVVLEATALIGNETSSRNSEVVHAGIYYPKDSLRARLCVAGKQMLYRVCDSHGVAAPKLGKLIVAIDDNEVDALRAIEQRATANGVTDLAWLDGEDVRGLEPAVRCRAALLSPSTGIVDSHGLMLALQGDAQAHGASIAFLSPIVGGRADAGNIVVRVGGQAPVALRCRELVNCAGLYAQHVASALEGFPAALIPPVRYAKGSYFVLASKSPFRRLIYPAPARRAGGWLGVHVTLDLNGQARFGPDMEWVERIDYRVDPARAQPFYAAVRRYWPELPDGALQPGYAGVRPKLSGPGEPTVDFAIQGPKEHGIPGLVNLFGIDSPGLTSCLSIADHIAQMLGIAVEDIVAENWRAHG